MSGDELDPAMRVRDYTDVKSCWLRGHAGARRSSPRPPPGAWVLRSDDVVLVRRGALALDVGRVGVPDAIREKPGPFDLTDRERVRLHPYFTERAFASAAARADGEDGRRASRAARRLRLPPHDAGGPRPRARILAVADAAGDAGGAARTAPRSDGRRRELLREATEGRLCRDAVRAVLDAAGHRVRAGRATPAGLTPREVEVLVALAPGETSKQIGETLDISTKTAGHHVEHIYAKAGVRTRGAATVWAFENAISWRPPRPSRARRSRRGGPGGDPGPAVGDLDDARRRRPRVRRTSTRRAVGAGRGVHGVVDQVAEHGADVGGQVGRRAAGSAAVVAERELDPPLGGQAGLGDEQRGDRRVVDPLEVTRSLSCRPAAR